MARHDEARVPDERVPRRDDADGPVVDQVVTTLKYGIDQVADKVKGLLRSPR